VQNAHTIAWIVEKEDMLCETQYPVGTTGGDPWLGVDIQDINTLDMSISFGLYRQL
jgi:hypothetical protein